MNCTRPRWNPLVITRIFNSSLSQHTVPFMWKLASFSPLPKESPLTECNHLRSISLTNIIVTIFERLVYKKELSYTLKLAIRTDQFAYKEGLNTTMALIACQHHWLDWLDKDGDFIRVFSFDFSVSHQVPCYKLKSYDINPYITNWIISFLSSRQQRVVVDDIVISFLNIDRGVPQGTILGLILFSIMVNDISAVSPNNLLIKFADDFTISMPVKFNSMI